MAILFGAALVHVAHASGVRCGTESWYHPAPARRMARWKAQPKNCSETWWRRTHPERGSRAPGDAYAALECFSCSASRLRARWMRR